MTPWIVALCLAALCAAATAAAWAVRRRLPHPDGRAGAYDALAERLRGATAESERRTSALYREMEALRAGRRGGRDEGV